MTEYIEIRLHLKSGQITVTDEEHKEIEPIKSKYKMAGISEDQPLELLEQLQNGEVMGFKSLPSHIIWTHTKSSPDWKCGWIWDYFTKSWIWVCVWE